VKRAKPRDRKQLRPWERRRIRQLSDEELIREVRAVGSVDRAVDRFRGKPS
jgi:hypothetical protein